MNFKTFLKAAERASVVSIANLEEAVTYWEGQDNGEGFSDGDDIDSILSELDAEGYIVYSDRDALDEFLMDIDPEHTLTITAE